MQDDLSSDISDIQPFADPVSGAAILAAAAKALASAVAARLVENAGDNLADAILGKNNSSSRFEQEVIQRLQRIETKVDEVFDLLSKLPKVIEKVLEKRDLLNLHKFIESNTVTLARLVQRAPAEGVQDANFAKELQQFSRDVLRSTDRLLFEGPIGHCGVIAGVTLAASSLCRAAAFDVANEKSYMLDLASMGAVYATKIRGWTGPDGTPVFEYNYTQYQSVETSAKAVLATLPANILLNVRQVKSISTQTLGWRAYFAFNPDTTIHASLQGEVWKSISPALPEPIDFDKFIPLGIKKVHWWMPRVSQPATPWDFHKTCFFEARAIVFEADRVVREYPRIILGAATAKLAVSNLLAALEQYARLEGRSMVLESDLMGSDEYLS